MPRETIAFPYKSIRGRPAPMITVGLALGRDWIPLEMYVDSGAAYSVVQASVARGLEFNYQAGERIYVQVGDGSFIPVYLHDLTIQLRQTRVVARVGFSEKLGIGFNLLGREGVFDRFRVCFDEPHSTLTFEPRAA